MKLGIMQPYLFPWIGYFQLVSLVDELVIYDDVQYIKNGWINRNRILINGQPRYFTLPVLKASHALPICERRFASSFERDKLRTLKSLEMAYAAAPHFRDTLHVGAGLLCLPGRQRGLVCVPHVIESLRRFRNRDAVAAVLGT